MTSHAQDSQSASQDARHKPEITFRHRAIGVSIWLQQTVGGETFYNFSLSRSWKNEATGKSGYSGSFSECNGEDLQ